MKNGAIELCDEDGNEFIVNKKRVKPYQKDALDFDGDDDVTLEDEGGVTNALFMEYLVKIVKKAAFWSPTRRTFEDTVHDTNTPYPSRKKYGVSGAGENHTSQMIHEGNKSNMPYLRDDQYAAIQAKEIKIFWKRSLNSGPSLRKHPIRRIESFRIDVLKPFSRPYK
ncbi:hypothetical protein Tco_0992067 [Tanacetum coccineum]|uniref:Uncharacterized protein n=1 Tax=Tanacetum coccineum TaxID=301880 RepID=A0ABQ5F141_9ASTR